jgi:hypothetical protein
MLSNMRIGMRLIVIGALILAVPLAVVAYIAVTESRIELQGVSDGRLSAEAQDLTRFIDKVYEEETKVGGGTCERADAGGCPLGGADVRGHRGAVAHGTGAAEAGGEL